MIVSHEGKFVIATPTKCGTTTLEAVARRHVRRLGDEGVRTFSVAEADRGDSHRRQHRMVPPEGCESYQAYLLVRNPLDRMVSIFEYLRAPQNYSQWGARAVQGNAWGGKDKEKMYNENPKNFCKFVQWYARQKRIADRDEGRGIADDPRSYRSPWVWTDMLWDSLDFLQSNTESKVLLIQLEELWDELDDVLREHGVEGVDLAPLHSNRSTGREHVDPVAYYTYKSDYTAHSLGLGKNVIVRSGLRGGVQRLYLLEEVERMGYTTTLRLPD